MNVLMKLMSVSMSVPTQLDHTIATAGLDTDWPKMENIALVTYRIM